MLDQIEEHPRTGIGKPERLKHFESEVFSRRIDDSHRLIYEIGADGSIVVLLAAYGHYEFN